MTPETATEGALAIRAVLATLPADAVVVSVAVASDGPSIHLADTISPDASWSSRGGEHYPICWEVRRVGVRIFGLATHDEARAAGCPASLLPPVLASLPVSPSTAGAVGLVGGE